MARDLKLEVVLAAIDKATGPIKAITQGSVGLARQLKSTRDTLKGLQGQQKDISSFKALKGASDQTRQAMQASTDRVKALSQELANTSNPTKALSNEFKRAVRESHSLKQKHGEQQRELQGLRGRLGEAGISTKNLGQHERDLRQKLASTNQTLSQQEGRLKRVTDQQNRLTKAKASYEKSQRLASNMATSGAAGLAAGAGVLYAGARIMAPGLEYGAQMSELQSVTRLDKDDDRFKMLKDQARALGASTAFSATEVGAGQTFLARAGFTPEAINSSMQDILNLALANGADLARTADIASNISSAFKIDPETEGNITRVADVLSGTAARANVDLEMLGDTMKYLGGAEDLNLTLEQAAAMSGIMGNIGIQGSQAGTAMRAMMNRLTGPAAAGAKAMDELGLKVAGADGQMRDMPDILRDINEATKEMGNVQRKAILTKIFGAEAGSGAAELVGSMASGDMDALLEQLENVAGENARMAATRSDNIAGDIKGLQSAWEEIGIGLSDTNEGPLRELITSLTGVVQSVGQWMKENPELVATIAKVVAVTAALVAVGGAIAITLASIIGPLAMIKYGFAMASVAVNAFSWPLLAIIAAIALLGVAAWMLWRNWDGVVGGLKALWSDMVGVARWAFDSLLAFFAGIWGEIKTAFDGGILGVSALIINWSPLGLFYKAFAGVMSYFGIDLPGKFTEFGGMLMSGMVSGITAGLGKVKDAITGAGDQAIGWFKDKLGIRSPSRVFAALGDDTMHGLQAGLERSKDGPMAAIIKAGKAVAGAAAISLGAAATPAMADIVAREDISIDSRPPLTMSGGPITVQGDTIAIHITAPPGSDTADLERMISRVLDERERNKAARIRSSLYDND